MELISEIADFQKDIPEIYGLWEENLPYNKNSNFEQTKSKFNWFYTENPIGGGNVILLKDRNQNNEIIGSIGLSLRKFKIGHKKYNFGLLQNFTVKKKYRTLGPAITLLRNIKSFADKNSIVLYGVAGQAATPAFKRVGFKEIGFTSRFVKVLNYKTYIEQKLKNNLFSSITIHLINFLSRVLSHDFWVKKPKNLVTEHFNEFNEEFDVLWKKGMDNYSIIEERTHSYLRWRFYLCPYQNFKIFCLKEIRTNTIVSYLIYRYEKNTIKIVDFFSFSIDNNLYYLFLEFIKYARIEKIESITIGFLGNISVKTILKHLGFSLRQSNNKYMFFFGKVHADIQKLFENEENLYLTSGDEND